MNKIGVFGSLMALACLAAGNAQASPTDNARAYGIAKFGPATCGESSQTHSAHEKSAAAFTSQMSYMTQFGLWGTASQVNNSVAGANLFTDPDRTAVCNCSLQSDTSLLGIDSVPVAYVHTHGGHSLEGRDGKGNSTFTTGNHNPGNQCGVGTDTNFFFGDPGGGGKLEIAIVKACQGADFDVYNQGGYRAMVPKASRFQVYNGFHGDSSCGGFVAGYVQEYVANSFVEGVGENWLDEAYDYDLVGNDDCPASIVYGDTKVSRKGMYANGGFIDRKLTNASKAGSTYFFVSGCSPSKGRKLPE